MGYNGNITKGGRIMVKVGDKLKDFVLKDQDNSDINTADYRGKKVLLSFHPLAFTGVCRDQMKSLEDHYGQLESLNTIPLGLSVDQPFSKAAWAEQMGIEKLRLLSDFWPHGGVAQELGIFIEEKGISQRANILVDEEGMVIFVKVYDIPQLPDLAEIIDFLEK